MAFSQHGKTGRPFGLGASRALHHVQRGVGGIMAAKGAWDTARTIYGLASAAAPYVAAAVL